jgi:outer membrane protein OmpA-like peptidoglycan-associated protein
MQNVALPLPSKPGAKSTSKEWYAMSNVSRVPVAVLAAVVLFGMTACASWGQRERGAVIGAGAGAAVGAAVGSQVGSTARGAIIGAAVGGAAGAVIGHQMDQQARDLDRDLEGATVARVGEGIVVTFEGGILFDFDRADLRHEARRNLERLARNLQQYDRTEVLIIGHTDSVGSATYNQGLSERRAQSAANYVVSLGVAPHRVSTRGMGEHDPIASNETAEGRQLNRRVEVVIYADENWRREVQN